MKEQYKIRRLSDASKNTKTSEDSDATHGLLGYGREKRPSEIISSKQNVTFQSPSRYKQHKERRMDFFRQMSCVLVVSFSMCIIGTSVGWSAIVPKIQNDNSTGFNVTETDVRWMVSSIFLASIPGNLFGGSLGELIGPRRFLLILLPLTVGCWAMQAFTWTLSLLHASRVFLGLIYGLCNTLVQPLVTEICEPDVRGVANILPEIIATATMLYSYLLAHFLPWRIGTALCGAPLIPTFLLLLFIPESPYWLMRRGKQSEAETALERLLGPARAHKQAIMMREIEASVRNQVQGSLSAQLRLFRRPQNWKPVLLVSVLIILRETSGRINIFMYTVYIFQDSGVDLDPFLCTTIVGITRLVNTIIAALLVERLGRKKLLLATVLTCGTVIIAAGVVGVVDQSFPGDRWIPLISILIYVVSYSTGVGPITWALMGELLPSPIRSLSTSVVCICFSASIFISNNTFPILRDSVGLGVCFIIFGLVSYLMGLVIVLFLPETKGRTLLELEKIFSKSKFTKSKFMKKRYPSINESVEIK